LKWRWFNVTDLYGWTGKYTCQLRCLPVASCLALLAATFSADTAVAESSLDITGAIHYASGSADLDDESHLFGATLFLDGSYQDGPWRLYLQSQIQKAHVTDDDSLLQDHALRQFYLDWRGDHLDLRIGRQLIIWGRSDRFNPTDIITPTDFRFLTADLNGQRFGATGISGRYFLNHEWSINGVALPEFSPTTLPRGLLPDGVEEPKRMGPSVGFDNPQLALRIERIGIGLDFSLSAYRGYSLLPAISIVDDELVRVHPRVVMFGADFAATVDQWGFRGELAYIDYRVASSDNHSSVTDAIGPRDNLAAVFGVERRLQGGDSVLVQILSQYLPDGRSTLPEPFATLDRGNRAIFGQFSRRRVGASATLLGQRVNDQLRYELSGAVHFNRGDWALRSRMEWVIDDNWKLDMAAEWFGGPADSRFGVLEDGSRLFVQLVRALPTIGSVRH